MYFQIIDLIAGLIFIYFLLSIVNNSMFEIFSSFFKLRAYLLKKWLIETFKNKQENNMCASAIMNHTMVSGLSKPDKSPSYMGAKSFAKVITNILLAKLITSGQTAPVISADALFQIIDGFGMPPKIAETLKTFLVKTKLEKQLNEKLNEVEHFEKQVEEWFDSAMERVGSRFKRRTFFFTIVFSTMITVGINVDSISLAKYLYGNPEARARLAAEAYGATSDSTAIQLTEQIKQKTSAGYRDTVMYKDLSQLDFKVRAEKTKIDSIFNHLDTELPIGWSDTECKQWKDNKFEHIAGWILTILAVCLGAPFWFELLTKIANIRSTIKPTEDAEKNTKKKSTDKQ